MLTSLKRVIRYSWISFKRQSSLTFATIFIMVMAISLIGFLFLFHQTSHFFITQVQEKADFSIYFKEGILEEDILNVKEEISKIPEVKNVEYISHQEATKKLLERHPELKESVRETEVILNLASLNIQAQTASQYQAIADFLDGTLKPSLKNFIEKVDYPQRKLIIEKIFKLTSEINRFLIFLSLILATIAILVAFNQIRLAIYNLRREITIQRLVGASNWFIRGPFLVQGVISGILATLISLLIFALVCWGLNPKIAVLFPDLNIFYLFLSNFWNLVLIQLGSGIGLGVISSLIAIRKYLRV